ncbi:MFS transporter [Penicillium subrubescens]|uniref:MFS transporter n=1 Tax=Penicillium subrubescens TaxID=1316194 RepID=UPI00254583B3|nr:MFS transporter [Penicillium subrubescens]KAJ5896700.1 MFS transporter [Penicillium subrubescens]
MASVLDHVRLSPQVITDTVFLHERGFYNTLYFTFYFGSFMVGPSISGVLALHVGWCSFWWLNVVGCALVVIGGIFFFPETKWHRFQPTETQSIAQPADMNLATKTSDEPAAVKGMNDNFRTTTEHIDESSDPFLHMAPTETQSIAQPADMNLATKTSDEPAAVKGMNDNFRTTTEHIDESSDPFLHMAPTETQSIAQPADMNLATKTSDEPAAVKGMNDNFRTTTEHIDESSDPFLHMGYPSKKPGPGCPPYNWSSQSVGFTNFALLAGIIIGLATSGPLSDWISMRATKKNRGIREPEMRLPAMITYVLIANLGNFIIAFGYEYVWDWRVTVIVGYTCAGIQVAALPTIASTYTVDSYKSAVGSIFVAITVNKNLWGYGFSLYHPLDRSILRSPCYYDEHVSHGTLVFLRLPVLLCREELF